MIIIPNPDYSKSYLEELKLWNVSYIYTMPSSTNRFFKNAAVYAKTIYEALADVNKQCEEKMDNVVFEDPEQHLIIHEWDSYQIISINLIK